MFLKSILRKNKKKIQKEFKFDLKKWMDLSKEKRIEIDIKEKNESMIKKKALLRSIREEYLKIKNRKT